MTFLSVFHGINLEVRRTAVVMQWSFFLIWQDTEEQ